MSDKNNITQPVRLSDQVAAVLHREIDSGVLRPGQTLATESELSRHFGVSRSVLREALSQLKYEGLLDSRQGKGITVIGAGGRRFLRFKGLDSPTRAELEQLFELRTILEGEAAALAALRCRPNGLALLEDCLADMARALAEDRDGAPADLAFHTGLAEASGNDYLRDL
ncbi:MAG: FadR family transcriptional regulator, partial [Deltaproteobacteria bacterium]|nr:FadR family transcriptional regulator [Deltaproteobacteria bacterium]